MCIKSSKEICSFIDSPCYLKFKCLSENLDGIKMRIGSKKEFSLEMTPIASRCAYTWLIHTVTIYTNNFVQNVSSQFVQDVINNDGRL